MVIFCCIFCHLFDKEFPIYRQHDPDYLDDDQLEEYIKDWFINFIQNSQDFRDHYHLQRALPLILVPQLKKDDYSIVLGKLV